MLSENRIDRCDLNDPTFRVNTNDKYSIRMLQPPGIQANIGAIQAKIGAIVSHHYIDIEKDLGNNNKCLITLGLRTENAKKAGHIGITKYLGTELLSPDFADAKCTGLMNKCKRSCKDSIECKSKCEEEKGGCLGANIYILNSNDKIIRGTMRPNYTDNKDYHNLNEYQVNIINWFLEHKTKIDDGRETPSYIANLPFTFSFTPNFCSIRDWGPNEYYNCQKFVSVFHNQAERIWNILKEYNTTPPQSNFEDWRVVAEQTPQTPQTPQTSQNAGKKKRKTKRHNKKRTRRRRKSSRRRR